MCSGVMNDGSLRIVRNGIGMIEQASVELPGIKGMWNLRATNMDAFDKYLVLSFVGETRILAINEDDELDEAEVAGFNQQSQVSHLLSKALMIVVASTEYQACRSLHWEVAGFCTQCKKWVLQGLHSHVHLCSLTVLFKM